MTGTIFLVAEMEKVVAFRKCHAGRLSTNLLMTECREWGKGNDKSMKTVEFWLEQLREW